MQAPRNTAGRAGQNVATSGMPHRITINKHLIGTRVPLAMNLVENGRIYGVVESVQVKVAAVAQANRDRTRSGSNSKGPGSRPAIGVQHRSDGKYTVSLYYRDKYMKVGVFEDAVLAAQAYDKTILKLEQECTTHMMRALNFPRDLYYTGEIVSQHVLWQPATNHNYKGVSWNPKHEAWEATLAPYWDGESMLSRHHSAEEAAKVRDKRLLRLYERGELPLFPELNFPQHAYNKIEIMTSFEMQASSRYNYVYSHNCKWFVMAPWRGKVKKLGCYTKAWDAAAVADLACIQQVAEGRLKKLPKLNFSLSHYWGRLSANPHTLPVSRHLDMDLIKKYLESCKASGDFPILGKSEGKKWVLTICAKGVQQTAHEKYKVSVCYKSRYRGVGFYSSELQAAQAYDKAVLKLAQQDSRYQAPELNFPRSWYTAQEIASQVLPWQPPTQHKYKGVSWRYRSPAWAWTASAVLPWFGRMEVGRFDSAEAAAKARDRCCLYHFKQGHLSKLPELNFPRATYTELEIVTVSETPSTQYSHVFKPKLGDWWNVYVLWSGTLKQLGSYIKESNAAAVADLAHLQQLAQGTLVQTTKLNFGLSHYWKMLADDTFPSCQYLDMDEIRKYLVTLLVTAVTHNHES